MYELCPRMTPGAPGKVTPTTFSPGATSWKPSQIGGTVIERCGSFASNAPDPVRFELTAQLLLPLSINDGREYLIEPNSESRGARMRFTSRLFETGLAANPVV